MSTTQRRAATVALRTSTAVSARAAAPLSAIPEALWRVRALRIYRGDLEATLQLDERERYVLGRHDAADVMIDAPEVSRLHGVLRAVDGRWHYEDYGSANGSALLRLEGAHPIAPHTPVALAAGDVVELGGPAARIELLLDIEPDDAAPKRRGTSATISRAARAFAERVELAARTRVPVFLLGPSGVGKTFTARRIHDHSGVPGPFVPINCARLPTEPSALHSELLGHVKGAYTGAEGARAGKLVLADGGTLFLDEVDSLPPLAQGFLLDVLEGSGDLAPLGAQAQQLKPVTFRLVAASKLPLADSGLRADLCERLAEGHLWRVPGLDERREDIPGLLRRFVADQEKMLGVTVVVTAAAVRFCTEAAWPGQIRQLRAAVVVLSQLALARLPIDDGERDGTRTGTLRPGTPRTMTPRTITLRDDDFAAHLAERAEAFGEAAAPATKADARRLTPAQVKRALAAAGGSVAQAARNLGISRATLAKKARDLAAGRGSGPRSAR